MSKIRLLLMMISESTDLRISAIPAAATRSRHSNLNGVVTMPTVSLPMSLAMRAMMGAAPVPVPPPIPAVTNTILVSSGKRLRMSSRLSSAA